MNESEELYRYKEWLRTISDEMLIHIVQGYVTGAPRHTVDRSEPELQNFEIGQIQGWCKPERLAR